MNKIISTREETLNRIGSLEHLPTLSDRFLKIREVIIEPHSNADDLAEIIATDMATSLTLLKIANSTAYNPMGNNLTSLPLAIARLGMATSAQIAMSMSLLQSFRSPMGDAHSAALWAHAFAVAQIAVFMAKQNKDMSREEQAALFMCGLLHDIGRLVFAIRIDKHYFERDFNHLHNDDLCHAEKQAYGIDHAEAGAVLLAYWNMSEKIVQAAYAHHTNDSNIVNFCALADDFVHQFWPHIKHIEEVQGLMRKPPIEDINTILQKSDS